MSKKYILIDKIRKDIIQIMFPNSRIAFLPNTYRAKLVNIGDITPIIGIKNTRILAVYSSKILLKIIVE